MTSPHTRECGLRGQSPYVVPEHSDTFHQALHLVTARRVCVRGHRAWLVDSRPADPPAARALDFLARLWAIRILRTNDASTDDPVTMSVFGQVLRDLWDAHYPGQWPKYEIADSRSLASSTNAD